MKINIPKQYGVPIQKGMIGLFFEDINYAADGGLYAEMLENRSFEFLKAAGNAKDYYTEYSGGYAWTPYPKQEKVQLQIVMGSPHTEENPHYMRLIVREDGAGMANQAYDGICLKKGMEYKVSFWLRRVSFQGSFQVGVVKDNIWYAKETISASNVQEITYNRFGFYETTITALENVTQAQFVFCLDKCGIVEVDFISMVPKDAVAGIFRKDLFEKIRDLHPGFLRFPGGCIVEGNTLANRYQFKDTLKPVWARKNNWSRWAVHGNEEKNQTLGEYCYYNQSLGLGYYEYFLLCELIGAKPIPVLNVGLACQYQSEEAAPIDSPLFQEFLQEAFDLLEFANGTPDTKWGAVRKKMGHEAPFGLEILGIGNEQWQTENSNFFQRYEIFEKEIHKKAPKIKLIGSAGPDITSEYYKKAWEFYYAHHQEDFVYAVDEHYYVKPEWMLEHVDFYDNYSRKVKVFSGEYAAHPLGGMNCPEANTLEGALAEAAFLTGIERNADVVILASYAPLFAKIGYAQWSPDMIWFDGSSSYATPSYYVQQMYADYTGSVTLDTAGEEKQAAKEQIFYSLSFSEKSGEIFLKIVNANTESKKIEINAAPEWKADGTYQAIILTGKEKEAANSLTLPKQVAPYKKEGEIAEGFELPPLSFCVIKIGTK